VGQIDAVFRFNSLADAVADPTVQQYMDQLRTLFLTDQAITDLQVWRVSQDVAGVSPDGIPIVTHSYLGGFYLYVSLPRVVLSLRDHPNLQVAIDRDAANTRRPGMILKSNLTNAVLQDVRFQPVFAGADYPWGAWQ